MLSSQKIDSQLEPGDGLIVWRRGWNGEAPLLAFPRVSQCSRAFPRRLSFEVILGYGPSSDGGNLPGLASLCPRETTVCRTKIETDNDLVLAGIYFLEIHVCDVWLAYKKCES